MIKWPNLFLYSSNAGGNTTGTVTYSKVPQHTWKAGELIRNKHWNNLLEAPPMFKKITITSETGTTIQFDISYEYAEKILLNGGGLFTVISYTQDDIAYNEIYYITLRDFQRGYYSGYSGSAPSCYWQSSSTDGYLQFVHEYPMT